MIQEGHELAFKPLPQNSISHYGYTTEKFAFFARFVKGYETNVIYDDELSLAFVDEKFGVMIGLWYRITTLKDA